MVQSHRIFVKVRNFINSAGSGNGENHRERLGVPRDSTAEVITRPSLASEPLTQALTEATSAPR